MKSKFKNSSNDVKKLSNFSKEKMNVGAPRVVQRDVSLRRSKERKLTLQQEVEKLRTRLRHEESVHRALERAFHRPLGVLPRLPPYLPQYTLELLAEVAVLEEEVVRLEKQVVNFRQGLYQEAASKSISSSLSFRCKKKTASSGIDLTNKPPTIHVKTAQSFSEESPIVTATKTTKKNSFLRQSSVDSERNQSGFSSKQVLGKKALNKGSCLNGKENQLVSKPKSSKRTQQKVSPGRPSVMPACGEQRSTKKREFMTKKQAFPRESDETFGKLEKCITNVNSVAEEEINGPTKLSEDLLKCLLRIFTKISRMSDINDSQNVSVFPSRSYESTRIDIDVDMNLPEIGALCDPYGICAEFKERDIGPYKNLCELSSSSIDLNRVSNDAPLVRRMKNNILQLKSVDLRGLTHNQKLAFWINIYNSCMMNAFLEYGIPDSPQKIVELMQKAVLNIGGHILNALTIEHFILRLPYHSVSKPAQSKGGKNDAATIRNVFGLDWPEPLVTFALACGSWSSPAVRIYTATKIEDELEAAKRDYLQAAIGISLRNHTLAIPKLLDWYLLDFAKDIDSLLDWICLQLPNELRREAVKCHEKDRKDPLSQAVQIRLTALGRSFQMEFKGMHSNESSLYKGNHIGPPQD